MLLLLNPWIFYCLRLSLLLLELLFILGFFLYLGLRGLLLLHIGTLFILLKHISLILHFIRPCFVLVGLFQVDGILHIEYICIRFLRCLHYFDIGVLVILLS